MANKTFPDHKNATGPGADPAGKDAAALDPGHVAFLVKKENGDAALKMFVALGVMIPGVLSLMLEPSH